MCELTIFDAIRMRRYRCDKCFRELESGHLCKTCYTKLINLKCPCNSGWKHIECCMYEFEIVYADTVGKLLKKGKK